MLTNENLLPPISSLPQISEQVKRLSNNTNDLLQNRSVTSSSLTVPDSSKMADTGIVFAFGKLHSQQSIDAKVDSNVLFSVANALLPLKFFLRSDFVTSVSCGDEHSAFISNTGRVFVIGKNSMGQLGLDLPLTQTVTRPTCIKSLKTDRIYRVGCGTQHTLLASETSDGKKKILAFGINSDFQLGIGRNAGEMCAKPQIVLDTENDHVLMLSGGHSHSVALLSDYRLLVWGNGPEGQLGLGDQIIECEFPTQLNPPPGYTGFTAVACGYYHTLVITTPSALFAAGEAQDGKLGMEPDAKWQGYVSELKQVELPEPDQITAISAGGNHSFAVNSKGHVYAMGNGTYGQLGVGTSVSAQSSLNKPSLLKSFADSGIVIKSVSAGESHSAFVTDDGRLFLCGNALHARLGFDVSANSFSPRLANLVDEASGHDVTFGVTSVACGGCHTVCLANKQPNTDQLNGTLTKPFGDTTNLGTTSTVFTASSGRLGRRARRSAAQSLNLTNSQPQNLGQTPSKSLTNLPPLVAKAGGTASIASTIPTTNDTTSTFSVVSTLPSDPATATAPIEQPPTMAVTAVLNSAPPVLESAVKSPPPSTPPQETAQPPVTTAEPSVVTPVAQPIAPNSAPSNPEVAKLELPPDSTRTDSQVPPTPATTTETPKSATPAAKKSGISLPLICGNKKQQATQPPPAASDEKKPDEPAENRPTTTEPNAAGDTAKKDGTAPPPGETKTTNATQPTKTCTIL